MVNVKINPIMFTISLKYLAKLPPKFPPFIFHDLIQPLCFPQNLSIPHDIFRPQTMAPRAVSPSIHSASIIPPPEKCLEQKLSRAKWTTLNRPRRVLRLHQQSWLVCLLLMLLMFISRLSWARERQQNFICLNNSVLCAVRSRNRSKIELGAREDRKSNDKSVH